MNLRRQIPICYSGRFFLSLFDLMFSNICDLMTSPSKANTIILETLIWKSTKVWAIFMDFPKPWLLGYPVILASPFCVYLKLFCLALHRVFPTWWELRFKECNRKRENNFNLIWNQISYYPFVCTPFLPRVLPQIPALFNLSRHTYILFISPPPQFKDFNVSIS